MPILEYSEDKLAKAMARLDSIQHPRGLSLKASKPPTGYTENQNSPHPDKLPELTSKAITNYKILKGRVETPTSKLVSKYWTQNKDRFANMSRLSAETAPGALQTVGTSSTEHSPVVSRVVTPAKATDRNIVNKKKEMTIFKTSKLLKSKAGKRNTAYHSSPNNYGSNKYKMLRSRSFAADIQESDEEYASSNNGINLTMHDLAQFSHKVMIPQEKHSIPLKTNLYNSFVDVKSFRRLLRDPEPVYTRELVERRYVNFCDAEKTIVVQEWLEEVNRIQRKEGYWTEIIDKSLIRQTIPKHVPGDLKEKKINNSSPVSTSSSRG